MNITTFQEQLVEQLKKLVKEQAEVKTNAIQKNNGIVMQGISILDKGTNIAPTIYVEAFYQKYIEQNIAMEELAKDFLALYQKSKLSYTLDASFFSDFNKVKNRIVFKLIHGKLNEALLTEIPHKSFMDLEMVFYYLCDDKELENGTILIRNAHCKMWGVSLEEVLMHAKKNTEKLLPCETVKMEDLIEGMTELINEKWNLENVDTQMYVMTNCNRIFGAATLLYDHAICQFAYEFGKNIYIIPSSVHELILILDDGKMNPTDLNAMVREVNETQLDPRDVLADHVYYYDYKDDILTACLG